MWQIKPAAEPAASVRVMAARVMAAVRGSAATRMIAPAGVIAATCLVVAVGVVATGCAAGSTAAVSTSSPSDSPGDAVSWAGRYTADDGRSVDPEAGYGGPLIYRLALSTLKITVLGDRYQGVIATPSLPTLPPNTLVFRAVSGNRRDLLAKPAPLTRIALHALTADSFSYVCRVRTNGRWTLFSRMHFHRVKSAG